MRWLSFVSIACMAGVVIAADPPAPPVIVDSAGTEITPKTWRFAGGMRKLTWLEKDAKAPEALAFRESNSTTFKDGVLTLIPMERLESLTYDTEKQSVSAKIAGVEKLLEGSIRYREINQVSIVAEVDRGTDGVVELTYRGGALKGGVRSIKFPGAKAGPASTGTPLFVTVSDGKQKLGVEAVTDLQALYRFEKGGEKLAAMLMFRKSYKLELKQIKKMTIHEHAETRSFECDVTLLDGTEQTLTLLTTISLDGKNATLEGLIGIVPAGFKLFPMHTIGELSTEEPKPEDKKPAKEPAGAKRKPGKTIP